MKPLEWRFQRLGYATRNWGYSSLRRSIEEHAVDFASYLNELEKTLEAERFHIVAHSMGSIITRCALQNHRFEKLGRVIMLCPPNRGSHMARRASGILRRSIRTLDQITDRADSFVNQLPTTTGVQVGIVAASGDLIVAPEATRLEDATDYVIVPGMHNSVLFKRSVFDLCANFLREGRFHPIEDPAPRDADKGSGQSGQHSMKSICGFMYSRIDMQRRYIG
jgi:pimeloyl-ACP methyl ester carboxylesterase